MSSMPVPSTVPPPPPRLLDQLRTAAVEFGHAEELAGQFAGWARAFILFHDKRHPKEMGSAEIGRYLDRVAATSSQPLIAIEAARVALGFLYGEVLRLDVGELPRPQPPKLLDQVRQVMRVRYYSPRTEECYVQWMRRYILFHGTRHPREMGAAEVEGFLTELAVKGRGARRRRCYHRSTVPSSRRRRLTFIVTSATPGSACLC